MAKRLRRQRDSGALRQLPSGRWQPAILEIDNRYTSLGTFRTRGEAEKTLAAAIADRHRGSWIDPRDGRVTFEAYSTQWLEERASLRPRTRELYEGLLRLHIIPSFGQVELGAVTPPMVRQWHAKLTRADRPGDVTIAKCYRLLKSIFATAVMDDLIPKNPCVLPGAGVEHSPERPIASINDVDRLVEIAPAHLKALILLATYTSLRLGELSALTRRNLDLDKCLVTVVASAADLRDGTRIIGEPKSAAGRRRVAIPEVISSMLRDHLDRYSEPLRSARLTSTWYRSTSRLSTPRSGSATRRSAGCGKRTRNGLRCSSSSMSPPGTTPCATTRASRHWYGTSGSKVPTERGVGAEAR